MSININDLRRPRQAGVDPLRSAPPFAGGFRAIAPLRIDRQGTTVSVSGSDSPAYDVQVGGLRSVVMPITTAFLSTAAIETSAQGALSGSRAWRPPV